MGKEVVLVTGGVGFVGQHLIRELQELCYDEVSEIRVVDKQPFAKKLTWTDNIPIVAFVGDLCNTDELDEAMEGTKGQFPGPPTVIFHTAGRNYNFSPYEDEELYERGNVDATKAIIDAMIRHNVNYLIHFSDAAVAVGYYETQYPRELSTETWEQVLPLDFGKYAETKFKSEEIVREANEKHWLDGTGAIWTGIVRPTALYGELDSGIVPYSLRFCRKYGCMIMSDAKFNCGLPSCFQLSYAGNLANFAIKMFHALQGDSATFGGETFFYAESTILNYYDYIKPFIENAGYTFSNISLPFFLVSPMATVIEFLLRCLDRFFGIRFDEQCIPSRVMARAASGCYFHFNMAKARLLLGHTKPKYEPKEAMQRTIEWWRDNKS